MRKIPSRIVQSINYVMFLYLYERWAWEDAKNSLNFRDVSLFYINNPQFNKKDFGELLEKYLNIEKRRYKFVERSKWGIKIADELANSLHSILSSDFSNIKEIKKLRRYLRLNKVTRGNIGRGIDKVFIEYRRDKDLISKLRSFLYFLYEN